MDSEKANKIGQIRNSRIGSVATFTPVFIGDRPASRRMYQMHAHGYVPAIIGILGRRSLQVGQLLNFRRLDVGQPGTDDQVRLVVTHADPTPTFIVGNAVKHPLSDQYGVVG